MKENKENTLKVIGQNIKQIRLLKNLTQEELAEKLDICNVGIKPFTMTVNLLEDIEENFGARPFVERFSSPIIKIIQF